MRTAAGPGDALLRPRRRIRVWIPQNLGAVIQLLKDNRTTIIQRNRVKQRKQKHPVGYLCLTLFLCMISLLLFRIEIPLRTSERSQLSA